MPRPRLADHVELATPPRHHRVPVHRRAVEGGHRDRARHVLGQHAAQRGVERDRLVPQPGDGLKDALTGLRDRDQVAHGAIFAEILAPSAVSGVRSSPVTPIRGPLARLERSRDELAKQWLVRLIERASLDEIRELPTEKIARELPG